jgi:hypothetical protein
MEAKLYVILGSRACRTGMLLLEHKGIDYERVELPTGLHPFALRLRGFEGNPTSFRGWTTGRTACSGWRIGLERCRRSWSTAGR